VSLVEAAGAGAAMSIPFTRKARAVAGAGAEPPLGWGRRKEAALAAVSAAALEKAQEHLARGLRILEDLAAGMRAAAAAHDVARSGGAADDAGAD
jgi:hypothetical protein